MRLLDQLKTTQGKVPVSSVELYRGEDGIERIHFFVQSDGDSDALQMAQSRMGSHNRKVGQASADVHVNSLEERHSRQNAPTLEDLAFLWDDEGQIRHERIADLAAKTGPLFGASEYERLSDWVAEASMAKDMINIQEVVNGDSPTASLDGFDGCTDEALVAKSVVRNRITHNHFSLYSYTLPLGRAITSDFYTGMPSFPHFKRFVAPGRFDYVFINRLEEEGENYLLVTLFAFKHDITALDFVLALDACSVEDEADVRALMAQAETEANLSAGLIDEERKKSSLGASEFEAVDMPIEKSDLPHIQRLVQAVVSLRLMGIGVDVFRSNESDDFLLFPMYASYLWYSFSKKLGQVKIGYCELCGRGFSLTGHRGMPRRFCSEECKTKAKNMRAKHQRDEIRRLFLEEEVGVQQIVQDVYADELKQASEKKRQKLVEELSERVCHTLSSYPAIKREIDKGLLLMMKADEGKKVTKDSINIQSSELAFVRRCVGEGLFSRDCLGERLAVLSRKR